jgi:hypothetical protein
VRGHVTVATRTRTRLIEASGKTVRAWPGWK